MQVGGLDLDGGQVRPAIQREQPGRTFPPMFEDQADGFVIRGSDGQRVSLVRHQRTSRRPAVQKTLVGARSRMRGLFEWEARS
jgi:hypothetical protein